MSKKMSRHVQTYYDNHPTWEDNVYNWDLRNINQITFHNNVRYTLLEFMNKGKGIAIKISQNTNISCNTVY